MTHDFVCFINEWIEQLTMLFITILSTYVWFNLISVVSNIFLLNARLLSAHKYSIGFTSELYAALKMSVN